MTALQHRLNGAGRGKQKRTKPLVLQKRHKNQDFVVVSIISRQRRLFRINTFGGSSTRPRLGIVTPYKAQAKSIRKELEHHGIYLSKVGTIHSLQGAEKPIIIFSSVNISDEKQSQFFFDKSPNMLNVAVSRAKQSFLVFGDMDTLDPSKGNLPSSLLAKYLFSKEENEIVDIIQPQYIQLNNEEIQQINSLEAHQITLKNAFFQAKHELIIVSPFLRMSVLEIDAIPELIKEHSSRISITIYIDPSLNKTIHTEFNQAIDMLRDANANVILVNNVHSKIIAIDNHTIIEGSFNWLSASRKTDKYQREESSIIYSGKLVSKFIQAAIDPIKKRQLRQEQ